MTIIANPGIDQQKFTVSKVLICSRSRYFDRALNGEFKESKRKEVELHDVDVQSLQALLYWVYHNQLQPDGDDYEYNVEDPGLFLVRLSILADMLMVPALQNKTLIELCERLTYDRLDADTICEIYNNTAPSSSLRQVACHVVACITLRQYHADDLDEYSSCFAELEDFGSDVCSTVNRMVLNGKGNFERAATFEYGGYLVPED